jgi:hypothetical protein
MAMALVRLQAVKRVPSSTLLFGAQVILMLRTVSPPAPCFAVVAALPRANGFVQVRVDVDGFLVRAPASLQVGRRNLARIAVALVRHELSPVPALAGAVVLLCLPSDRCVSLPVQDQIWGTPRTPQAERRTVMQTAKRQRKGATGRRGAQRRHTRPRKTTGGASGREDARGGCSSVTLVGRFGTGCYAKPGMTCQSSCKSPVSSDSVRQRELDEESIA